MMNPSLKPVNFYSVLLSIVYAVLYLVGNYEAGENAEWYKQVAPWLGEAPEGLVIEQCRATDAEEYPVTMYHLPADEGLKQKIISTFELEENDAGIFDNHGVCIMYPEGKEEVLSVSDVIYPRLHVSQDGSMNFSVDDYNMSEQKNASLVKALQIPYPDYLPNTVGAMARSILLAVLCYLLPGIFCCVGWLWIQRRPISCRETAVICFAIPAAVAFIGAYVDFYSHGFHQSYAVFSAVFSVITNLLCAGILIAATKVERKLWGTRKA